MTGGQVEVLHHHTDLAIALAHDLAELQGKGAQSVRGAVQGGHGLGERRIVDSLAQRLRRRVDGAQRHLGVEALEDPLRRVGRLRGRLDGLPQRAGVLLGQAGDRGARFLEGLGRSIDVGQDALDPIDVTARHLLPGDRQPIGVIEEP